MTMMSNNNKVGDKFGDTTQTKVFVGGLPWETPKEVLREHFEKYGEILEAVVIFDKQTGRSKGYGFVTFKEAEAAKKACEDPALIINGRRPNCNLASLGARRPIPRSSSTAGSPPQGSNGGVPRNAPGAAPNHNQLHWYYPAGTLTPVPASPPLHHPLPFYGYTPNYIATDINYDYNQKLSYGSGGAYMNGQLYPSHVIMGANALAPMYPVYQFPRTGAMGVPAQFFQPTLPPHFASVPASSAPNTGTVGTGDCFRRLSQTERSFVGK